MPPSVLARGPARSQRNSPIAQDRRITRNSNSS